MRLLICTGIFPPDIGGPASYSKKLAEALAERGHKVKVITYFGSVIARNLSLSKGTKQSQKQIAARPAAAHNDGYLVIRIIRSSFKPWHHLKYLLAVLWHGRSADVIYAQGPVSEGFPTYLANKILRKPFVVKITGDYSWEQAMHRKFTVKLIDDFQRLPSYPEPIQKLRAAQITVCQAADLIIAPSQYLKRMACGWGIDESKVKVIYNAVDLPEFIVRKSEVRKKLGINDETFLMISSGRNMPWKGFAMLREVNTELKSQYPNIDLQIFHDLVRETLWEYIKAADLYVLNTGYEGLSNTLVEVLNLETPIITTRVSGNPEVVQDGFNGLLVDYNNKEQLKEAILKIYREPELVKTFVANAAAVLPKFAFTKMINQTEELLKSCAF